MQERIQEWLVLLSACELEATPTAAKIDRALESGTVWLLLHNEFARTLEPMYEQVLEAMELMALLAQVDYEQWLLAFQTIWPRASRVWLHAFSSRRIFLGCELVVNSPGVTSQLCNRFLGDDAAANTTADEKYHSLRSELRAAYGRKKRFSQHAMGSRECVVVPVRVTLHNDSVDWNHAMATTSQALLQEMLELATRQATAQIREYPDDGSTAHKPSLCVRLVEVNVAQLMPSSHVDWDETTTSALVRQIVNSGVAVSPRQLTDMRMTNRVAPQFTHQLQQLLATNGRDHDGGGAISPHRALTLVNVPPTATTEFQDSIFSGILASSSVRELSARGGSFWHPGVSAEQTHRFWSWIAVAGFSGIAPPTLRTIMLDMETFKLQHVSVLETILKSDDDPMMALFPGTVRPSGSVQTVVSASTFYRAKPPTDAAMALGPTIDFDTPLKDLRVLATESDEHDPDWISVLLPGYGRAWVAAADALMARRSTSAAQRDTGATIHLSLEAVSRATIPVIVALLRVIGHRVRKLTLTKSTVPLHRSVDLLKPNVHDLLRACPHLEEFDTGDVGIRSLQSIAAAYQDGNCAVQRLVLHINRLDHDDTAYKFFALLAHKNHPMTRHLRALQLVYHPRFMLPDIQHTVLRMLQRNKSLTTLQLDLSVRGRIVAKSGPEHVPEHEFARCDGFEIGGFLRPLAFQKRLAFLNVVSSESSVRGGGKKESAAIHALDSSVITTIFAYAAQCRTRLVQVQFYN